MPKTEIITYAFNLLIYFTYKFKVIIPEIKRKDKYRHLHFLFLTWGK